VEPERGHYRFPVSYPRLEARQVLSGSHQYVVIVNHTAESVTAPTPFISRQECLIDDLTGQDAGRAEVTLGPFGVLVGRVSHQVYR